MSTTQPPEIDIDSQYKFGWHDDITPVFTTKKGLSAEVVDEISRIKGEPEWMRNFRLRALEIFERKPMPSWGGDLSSPALSPDAAGAAWGCSSRGGVAGEPGSLPA